MVEILEMQLLHNQKFTLKVTACIVSTDLLSRALDLTISEFKNQPFVKVLETHREIDEKQLKNDRKLVSKFELYNNL